MRKFVTLILVVLSCSVVFSADNINTEKLENVLFPCVRVLNGNGGGSGTVIYSEDREASGEFQTFVLTNHHVIAKLLNVTKKWDNLTKSYKYVEDNDLADVEMFTYVNSGQTVTISTVKAEVVAYVADEDIALLRLMHPFQVKSVARILPETLSLQLFQDIYAVGCPLLLDPTFTKGEVTDLDYVIDKKSYVGGTADIIWGNSGGAVISKFSNGNWYFCGIPSRGIGAPNGQFMTYLGYYVSPSRIRGFVKSQLLTFLLDPTKTPTECFKARDGAAGTRDPDAPANPDVPSNEGEPEGPYDTDGYEREDV